MKQLFCFIFILFFSFPAFAINPYEKEFLEALPELTRSFAHIQQLIDARNANMEKVWKMVINRFPEVRIFYPDTTGMQLLDSSGNLINNEATRQLNAEPLIQEDIRYFVAILQLKAEWSITYQPQWTDKYAWAIPTDKAIEALKRYADKTKAKGIVEVGAGKGYWASLLLKEKVEILAFDNHSDFGGQGGYHFPVQNQPNETAKDYPDHMLMFCFPPRNDMAFRELQAFKGNYVAYIGEPHTTKMATIPFFDALTENFDIVEKIELPNWPDFHTALNIAVRKGHNVDLEMRSSR